MQLPFLIDLHISMFTFLMLDPLVHVVSNILFLTILRSFVCSEVTTFASVQAALESMIFSSLIFASWNKYLNAYWKKSEKCIQTNVSWNWSIRVSKISISLHIIADFRVKNNRLDAIDFLFSNISVWHKNSAVWYLYYRPTCKHYLGTAAQKKN